MQRVAIIDLGSNSARLVITRIYKNNSYQLIYAQKASLRLGQRLNKNGEITKDAVKDIIDAIKKFAHMCRLFNAQTVFAVATAAMRIAKNGAEIAALVEKETGIEMKIISGEQEATYGYLGVINTIDVKNAILFDLGGGSLEIALIKDRQPQHLVSLNIGTTTMTEKFKTANKVSSKDYRALTAYVEQKLKKNLPWLKNSKLPVIGIGGTVRNIAKIHQRHVGYAYPKLHNYRMQMSEFDEVFNMIRNTTYEERRKIPGLSSERADIIMAGAAVINTLFATVNAKEFIISGCGLREGVFLEYQRSVLGLPNIIEDILYHSIQNLLSFTLGNDVHSQKITAMSEKMFTCWQALHKLSDEELRILYIAANLHDVGISINYYAHPRHSAYLIENAPLMGLTHKEQIMAALVAQWHNGVSVKTIRNRLYKDFLTEKDLSVAKKLAVFLSMAENLDFTETNVIKEIYPDILADGRAVLGISTDDSLGIELGELQNDLDWFKREFKIELVVKKV